MSAQINDADRQVEPEDDVPEADGLRFGLCPHCDSVHLVLLDAAGEPMMVGSLTPAQWDEVVGQIAAERAASTALTGMPPVMGRA